MTPIILQHADASNKKHPLQAVDILVIVVVTMAVAAGLWTIALRTCCYKVLGLLYNSAHIHCSVSCAHTVFSVYLLYISRFFSFSCM